MTELRKCIGYIIAFKDGVNLQLATSYRSHDRLMLQKTICKLQYRLPFKPTLHWPS